MKILITAFLFCITLLAGAELGWSNDYKKAIDDANVQNKDIYVLITASDCRWCRKFENTTLQEKDMIDYLKSKYVLVHLDRDFDDLPEHLVAKRVPTHYFVTKDGKIIHTFPGYWSSEDFKVFLGDIEEKKLKLQK